MPWTAGETADPESQLFHLQWGEGRYFINGEGIGAGQQAFAHSFIPLHLFCLDGLLADWFLFPFLLLPTNREASFNPGYWSSPNALISFKIIFLFFSLLSLIKNKWKENTSKSYWIKEKSLWWNTVMLLSSFWWKQWQPEDVIVYVSRPCMYSEKITSFLITNTTSLSQA